MTVPHNTGNFSVVTETTSLKRRVPVSSAGGTMYYVRVPYSESQVNVSKIVWSKSASHKCEFEDKSEPAWLAAL
jgi:hypothetical protein